MSEPIQVIECSSIGVVMDSNITFEEKRNVDGSLYWKATQQIGSLFGSEVEGECSGIGRSKEEALERLKLDIKNLGDSLWA